MKLVIVLLCTFLVQASASTYAQKVTLQKGKTTLKHVFQQINQQTGYDVIWKSEQLKNTKPITINFGEIEVQELLDQILPAEGLAYTLAEKTIVIKEKKSSLLDRILTAFTAIEVRGKVVDSDGNPLAGATIKVTGTGKSTISDQKGEFSLTGVDEKAIIEISYIGFKTVTLKATDSFSSLKLEKSESKLDEVQVIAYGTTTRRLATGNVATVKAEDIAKQPVNNPLLALEGRVAGLVVSPTKGLPGAAVNIQIRGRNSIAQGSNPLFIIDGVPFAAGNNVISQLGSALKNISSGGVSPFTSLNPSDIESVEILKDADALAIYGSKGANGAVLITTKKGKAGKAALDVNFHQGQSHAANMVEMMNTQEYIELRKEAFKNDGVIPNASNAYDLTAFDQTKYTDFRKLLIRPADNTNIQARYSGGNETTQFALGTGYAYETTVLSGNTADKKVSLQSNIGHQSVNKKLSIQFSTIYSYDKNDLLSQDLASLIKLSPNTPDLYDSNGNLNWQIAGVNFPNPLASRYQTYNATTENLLTNINARYKLFNGFSILANAGYSSVQIAEKILMPLAANNPAFSSTGSISSGENVFRSLIVEPQLEYKREIGRGKLTALLGGSWQGERQNGLTVIASGYTNDALIGSISAATSVSGSNSASIYHYQAFFGRINYDYADRYIVNLTGRRDGSSRFGPGRQFGNFAAIGGAWIFSKEKFLSHSKLISFGKIRMSYGSTGNDQIGDYNYLNLWTARQPYNGSPGLYPSQHFNPNYEWEMNKKLEMGIDLGFFNDRIYLSGAWYRNRSSNQLIAYRLPIQTGFATIPAENFPAVVENSGLEVDMQTQNITSKNFRWTTGLNLSLPKNKVLDFPGLAGSTYANTIVIGQSLTVVKGFEYTGVDKATGVFSLRDVNGDGLYNTLDYTVSNHLDPMVMGGISNTLTYKNFQFDVFVEGRRQYGNTYIKSIYENSIPGNLNNVPKVVADRWRNAGDNAIFQKSTANFGTPAQSAILRYSLSDAQVSDVSYLRFKNISIAYSLSQQFLNKIHISKLRFYLNGQNLFVLSNTKGMDPQAISIYTVPVLKTIVAGLQLTL